MRGSESARCTRCPECATSIVAAPRAERLQDWTPERLHAIIQLGWGSPLAVPAPARFRASGSAGVAIVAAPKLGSPHADLFAQPLCRAIRYRLRPAPFRAEHSGR